MGMDVTLPAWCFAKAAVVNADLFHALFEKASVTAYESKSRHHKQVTDKEMLMSWAQLYFAYSYCHASCPAALQALGSQLRKDLVGISERRSGASSELLSEASGLRNERVLSELDRIIGDLAASAGSGGDMHFQDSLEDECTPTSQVANANAAASQQLLGKVPTPIARIIVLEFRRDPELFHATLMEGDVMSHVRQLLEARGCAVQLPRGPKIFTRPEIYEHACEFAGMQTLQPRHVVLEAQFEESVIAAITSLPSKLQVRLKSRSDNNWIFAPKTFPTTSIEASTVEQDDQKEEPELAWIVKRTFVDVPLPSLTCQRQAKSA